jgi:hypothetical protein
MRHGVSQQNYAKSIQVSSWFFRACTTLSKQRNRSGSGAWALNPLKNRRNPLEFALIPDI